MTETPLKLPELCCPAFPIHSLQSEKESLQEEGDLYASHSSVFWMRDLLYPRFHIIPSTRIHVCLQDEHVTLRAAVYSCMSCSLYKPLALDE